MKNNQNENNKVDMKKNKAEDTQWFYVIKTAYNDYGDATGFGRIYNIDKEGNLIANLNVDNCQLTQSDGQEAISEEDKKKLLKSIKNSKEQIDFLARQNELESVIKGFPEVNEPILRLFDPQSTIIRFKNERSLLRAIFTSRDNDIFRALLSLAALNKVELFNELIDNGILKENDFYAYIIENTLLSACKTIYMTMIYWINNYSKMPSVEFLANQIGIPYYKEVFDSYLWDEEVIETWVTANYTRMKEHKFKFLMSEINRGSIKEIDEIVDSLNDIQSKYDSSNLKLDDKYDDLETYLEEKENEVTLSTGIKALDDRSFQLVKGKICSIFAYTGSFKTMFCTNVAYNAMKNGANVVYISLEIDKREMYFNFLSRHSYSDTFETKISHSDIKVGRINEDEKTYLFNELSPHFKNELKEHLIVYDETDISSNTYSIFTNLLSKAENKFMKETGKGVDLIIVDHINLLKFGGERMQNDYSSVNHWMAYFRKNSIDFLGKGKQVAILCAAQSSREGFKEATKNHGKYSLTSIAEGNEIERSAAYVLSIYTSDEDRKKNKTQIQILKYRDDAHDDNPIPMLVDPKYYAFGIGKPVENKTEDEYSNEKNDPNITQHFNRNQNIQHEKVSCKNND